MPRKIDFRTNIRSRFLIAVFRHARKTDGKPIILVATRISREMVKNPFSMNAARHRSFESTKGRLSRSHPPVAVRRRYEVSLSFSSRIPRSSSSTVRRSVRTPRIPVQRHAYTHVHMFSFAIHDVSRARNPTTACTLPRACARA